jgi:hypothetical protein
MLFATTRREAALFQFTARSLQFPGKECFMRRNGLVFGGENLGRQIVEGIMRLCGTFFRVEDETNTCWFDFRRRPPILLARAGRCGPLL